jgi:hypothetical protein
MASASCAVTSTARTSDGLTLRIRAPKVDLTTGKLSGSIYSANCGWISLSNAFAYVQTHTIANGADADGDGIADAWELTHTNTLTVFTATSDTDHDGASDRNEYFADTNPFDPNSKLAITAFSTPPGGISPNVTWNSVLTRIYRIEKALDLAPPLWFDNHRRRPGGWGERRHSNRSEFYQLGNSTFHSFC